MDRSVDVHLRRGEDVSNALIVVGAPTVGLVGTITGRYLVDKLDLRLIGGLRSPQFPPISLVHDGRPSLPVRLYAIEARCGVDLDCDRLVVVTTEFVPGAQLIHAISDALVRWAREQGSPGLLVPDGLMVEGVDEETAPVRGVASLEEGLELLGELNVEPLGDGLLSGLSAALLYDSERLGLNTICLLPETHPEHPDARAAARVVSLLDRIIPEIDIETKPLIEEAEAIESHLQALRQQFPGAGSPELADPSVSMYG